VFPPGIPPLHALNLLLHFVRSDMTSALMSSTLSLGPTTKTGVPAMTFSTRC
jgi:hypothetical protein